VSEQTIPVEDVVKVLPAEIQDQVRDFIEFLLEKRARKPGGKLKLHWTGALRDWRDQFTSVELQHKALDWWGD